MKHLNVVLTLLLVLLVPGSAHAEPCKLHAMGELWAENGDQVAGQKIVGLDLALAGCPSAFSGVRFGVSYYTSQQYLYSGLTGSYRLQYGDRISPFIGVGLLGGFGEKEVDASKDGKDNNQNGYVDEAGEKAKLSDRNLFLYPEVGVTFFTPGFGLTLSARQYYGSKFVGNVIVSFGLVLPLD